MVNKETVTKKLNSLRFVYKKVRALEISATAEEDVYKSFLWFFDLSKF